MMSFTTSIPFLAFGSFLFFSPQIQAQERIEESFRDSINTVMLAHTEKSIHSIYEQLDSIRFVNVGEREIDLVTFDQDDVNLFRKLGALKREVSLDYNKHVRSYIDLYSSKNYKGHMSKMLGLAQYYFPIYDQALADVGVPLEIKYLSIVESALNPQVVSKAGATGPWQFMYATAKIYELSMNNYIDERKDPYASSYAAAKYLKESYQEFGDWLLAIASYNCGKGNIKRAILKSGKLQPSFWEIAPYLPRETRNYVPAYIAMTYMFGYQQELEIEAASIDLHLATESIFVDKFIALADVSKALNLSLEELQALNPAYKKAIVNGSVESPKRLIIPLDERMNKEQLYAALNTPVEQIESIVESADDDLRLAQNKGVKNHVVKKGETVGVLAKRYGVSAQNIKAWNNLSSNNLVAGRTVVVTKGNPVDSRLVNKVNSSVAKKDNYVVYTVKRGDTLSGIASQYRGVTVHRIKTDNKLSSAAIKPGMKLKITRG